MRSKRGYIVENQILENLPPKRNWWSGHSGRVIYGHFSSTLLTKLAHLGVWSALTATWALFLVALVSLKMKSECLYLPPTSILIGIVVSTLTIQLNVTMNTGKRMIHLRLLNNPQANLRRSQVLFRDSSFVKCLHSLSGHSMQRRSPKYFLG